MDILKHIQEDNLFIGKSNFMSLGKQIIKLKHAMVLYCIRGKASIEIDMCRYDLRNQSQVIMLPNFTFSISHISADFEATIIAFSPQLFWEASTPLNPMFFEQMRNYPCVQLTEHQTCYINSFISAIANCQLNKDNVYWQTIVRNIIQCFLLDIADMNRRFQLENPTNRTRPEVLFKSFVQLLAEHCMYEREVNFYANKLCITPRYLSFVVRKITGNTAKEMIDTRAILEIKTLLKTTNMTIQELTYELGFPNQSFFCRYFKKYTGVTPVQYRKDV